MLPAFNNPGSSLSFDLTAALPREYNGFVLRGGKPTTAKGEAGVMVLQEYEHPQFSIRFNVFNFLKPVKIPAQQQKSLLSSFLAIKNSLQYSIKGLGNIHLKQGQFALFHTGDTELTARFDKGKEYQSFELSWSEEIVRQASPYFQLLASLFPTAGAAHFKFLERGRHARPAALELVDRLLRSPYDIITSRFYFEHKVSEYLFLLLIEAGKAAPRKIRLTKEEELMLLEIKAMLGTGIGKPPTHDEIVSLSNMNGVRLSAAFKERFGEGLFEHNMAARMNEALRLLKETNLTTKEVAGMLGYKLTTSFIEKFSEHFGYPPGEVKRNR